MMVDERKRIERARECPRAAYIMAISFELLVIAEGLKSGARAEPAILNPNLSKTLGA